jgi:DNA replication and repair protein RecF
MLDCKIYRLQVKNFRNLKNDVFEFSPGINCILGQNGNGKTNLLEAIYYLFNHHSFRKNSDFSTCLSVDSDEAEFYLSASLTSSDNELMAYSGRVSLHSQEWFLNNKTQKKKIPFATIFINPFDSHQFFSSSQFRRDTLDYCFAFLEPRYDGILKKFKKYLKMRNFLLSHKPTDFITQIKSIDINLAPLCFDIMQMRLKLIDELNFFIPQIFQQIFSLKHNIALDLSSKWKNLSADEICFELQKGLKLDAHIGHTKYSLHKDDYVLLFDDFDAVDFCSLGQQKMSYLSLLFAYIELFRYKLKTFPLVLLDDLSGELDEARWKLLVQFLNRQEFQVLITSANEKFKEELDRLSKAKNFLIDSGSLVQN